jgi:DNA-binding helix-hairpin-helix protein with protein kinase domain
MTEYKRSNGWAIHLGNAIGGGGEGRIYRTVEEPGLVAKIYTTATHEKEAKLTAMLGRTPDAHTSGHFPLAWPRELLYNRENQCVGFLMPYIDHKDNESLFTLYNPKARFKALPDFSWKYLLYAAMNLSHIVKVLHDNGYVIGDINESNILISRSALVTLVDCDSIQVPRGGGSFFRCPVGKPEYTPPELQGRDLHSLDRQTHDDNFGLAVLIFLMLMEGINPFSGIWQGTGEPPTLDQNMRAGNSPYLPSSKLVPPRRALPFRTLPESIQTLMIRCLGEGHKNPSRRPTAHEWYQELHRARQQITSCHINSQHWYSRHLSSCPWCERMRQGIDDPFPPLRAPTTTAKHALHPITQSTPPPSSARTVRDYWTHDWQAPTTQPTPPPAYPTPQPTPLPTYPTVGQRPRSATARRRRSVAQTTPSSAGATLNQTQLQTYRTTQQQTVQPTPAYPTPPTAPPYSLPYNYRSYNYVSQLQHGSSAPTEQGCGIVIWAVLVSAFGIMLLLAGIGKIVTGDGSLSTILSCIFFFVFSLILFIAAIVVIVDR